MKTPIVGIMKLHGHAHESSFHTKIWTGSDLPVGR